MAGTAQAWDALFWPLPTLRLAALVWQGTVVEVKVIARLSPVAVFITMLVSPPRTAIVPLSGVCTPFVMHVFLPLATHCASRRSWSRATPSK